MPTGDANAVGTGSFLELLRRQWLPVLLCLLLGIGAAFAYVALAPREYRAVTSVLVEPIGAAPTGAPRNATQLNLDTEAQLVTSTGTVVAAAELLGVPSSQVRSLAAQVDVTVPPSSEILEIAFTGETADVAQRGARAFAEAYLEQRTETAQDALDAEDEALQARIDEVTQQLTRSLRTRLNLPANSAPRSRVEAQIAALNNQLTNLGGQQNQIRSTSVVPGRIVTEPTRPSSPSSPDAGLALGLGALLGLLAGLGIAVLRHRADDVIRTSDDVSRRAGVPVTAELPTRLSAQTIAILPPLGADGRAYARLRNLVSSSLDESSRRVVLVAGVRRGGGPVAANLAASLARSGEEVVLVCADVFGDTARALLGAAPSAGLTEVLSGERDVDSVARRLDGLPSLRILGPGRDPDRADELLQTRSSRALVDRLLASASYVVIEAPPTTDSADAQTLANMAELAVLVVETGTTSAREVLDASAQLESMGTPVLGAVLVRYGRDGGGERPEQRAPQAAVAEDVVLAPRADERRKLGDRGAERAVDPVTAPGPRGDSSP